MVLTDLPSAKIRRGILGFENKVKTCEVLKKKTLKTRKLDLVTYIRCVLHQGRIKLFGAPRQWKNFRPLFQAVFLSGGEGVLPPPQTESNTTPPSPKTEITNILFYVLNFASIIKFKM